MKKQIADILKLIQIPVDIVWSFDLGNFYPFSNFNGVIKIFHPVDEPISKENLKAANGADIILSVTQEILEKYALFKTPKYLINHGVADYFFQQKSMVEKDDKIRIGISGNMLRTDIDRPILISIIQQHPELIFEVWGSVGKDNNLAFSFDAETITFIDLLSSFKNVILHGPVNPQKLAIDMKRMDAFLICYDVQKDQSRGTNYHKIMEYLSTGSIIVSNNVTTYASMPDFVQMVQSRTDNIELSTLFGLVIQNLDKYNCNELKSKRIEFAYSNLYSNQLDRIERLLPDK